MNDITSVPAFIFPDHAGQRADRRLAMGFHAGTGAFLEFDEHGRHHKNAQDEGNVGEDFRFVGERYERK